MITKEIIKVVKQEVLDHKSWDEIHAELRFNGWTESDIKLIYAIVFQHNKTDSIAKSAKEYIDASKPKKTLNVERIATLFLLAGIIILVDILIIQINPQAISNIRGNFVLLQERINIILKK